jgi:hypothetical protein
MPFTPVTDLYRPAVRHHALTLYSGLGRSVDVHRQTCFRAGNGSFTFASPSALHSTLPRQPPRKAFQLPGPVSLHSLRATHLPGESARYPSLPQCPERHALSHGYSYERSAQHFGRGQRKTRLAHLRSFRSITDPDRSATLCQRRFWPRTRQHGSYARCLGHRSLLVGLSVGAVSADKSLRQIAYFARPTGQYPVFYPSLRRQAARCQSSRPAGIRNTPVFKG